MEAPRPVSPPWHEAVDDGQEGSGAFFYYNEEDQSSTWERYVEYIERGASVCVGGKGGQAWMQNVFTVSFSCMFCPFSFFFTRCQSCLRPTGPLLPNWIKMWDQAGNRSVLM